MDVALPPLIFVQESAWYALVALAFSASRPRAIYLRAKTWIDRAAGAVIGLLGVRLILESR
jgi:threonine/homoserine/homoserine lactone efflux protein